MGSSVATPLRKIKSRERAGTRTIGVGTCSALYISLEYSNICYKEKKSGKWRLLHDLREINKQMILMGPVQRRLPLPSALPQNWPIIVLDIKDCFFSIPLHPNDMVRFAFTVPSQNHAEPDKRFEWTVLPQGMANSPTMCQLYVDAALKGVRERFPNVKCYHYMDDILLAAPRDALLDEAYSFVVTQLKEQNLVVAPEKVQKDVVVNYLGTKITAKYVSPQKIQFRTDGLCTLNDFQKLLGDIQWVRPYLSLTNKQLQPLYDILPGNTDLNSPRYLTDAARKALLLVEQRIQSAALKRRDESKQFILCVLQTESQPTGVLWQGAPLLWIHPKISPAKTLVYYPASVAQLALIGIQQSMQFFGVAPESLIVPYNAKQIEVLTATEDNWAILRCSFQGLIDNHYPKDPILQLVKVHPVIFPRITARDPLPDAPLVFTDGSKTGQGAYLITGSSPVTIQFPPASPQVIELQIVIKVFELIPGPFNLISDSQYVVNMLQCLEIVGKINLRSTIGELVIKLQRIILNQHSPFFIQHIRAHTGLPGPLAEGNDIVDKASRKCMAFLMASSIDLAHDFHAQFHVNSKTLPSRFKIS